jgi:hypothetical protein
MNGQIDSSFTTEQRDLFASGIVAEIGVNAYAVWSAIKYYADYNTGQAWPGMRTLGEKLGLSKSTVQRALQTLEGASMVRVTKPHGKFRGQTYIARERLCVRMGSRVLCVIVIDYVPAQLRGKIEKVADALATGNGADALADVEIIPGTGFVWDAEKNALRGRIAARELPKHDPKDDHFRQLGEAMLRRLEKPLKK